jgi:hypothetical protein
VKWHEFREWYRWYRPYPPRESELHEKGWTVDHYFRHALAYDVTATFSDWYGLPVANAAQAPKTETFNVLPPTRPPKSRTKVEAVRLLIALFVVLAALMTGARDQLMKADLLPGLAAVFALGFAADTVKNLLTQKQ